MRPPTTGSRAPSWTRITTKTLILSIAAQLAHQGASAAPSAGASSADISLMLSAFRGPPRYLKYPLPFESGVEDVFSQRPLSHSGGLSKGREELPEQEFEPVEKIPHQSTVKGTVSRARSNRAGVGGGGPGVEDAGEFELSAGNVQSAAAVAAAAASAELKKVGSSIAADLDEVGELSGVGQRDRVSDHAGSVFRYDVSKRDLVAWRMRLWHSALNTAHTRCWPVVLALITGSGVLVASLLGPLMFFPAQVWRVLKDHPQHLLVMRGLQAVNITFVALMVCLACVYCNVSRLPMIALTFLSALLLLLSYPTRVPAPLRPLTSHEYKVFAPDTILALKISLAIAATLVTQILFCLLSLVAKLLSRREGSRASAEDTFVRHHRAGSQLLFALTITGVSMLYQRVSHKTARKQLRDPQFHIDQVNNSHDTHTDSHRKTHTQSHTQRAFRRLNYHAHVFICFLLAYTLVGAFCHWHNYRVYRTEKGQILLFDPLVFFAPFSSSLLQLRNAVSLACLLALTILIFVTTHSPTDLFYLDPHPFKSHQRRLLRPVDDEQPGNELPAYDAIDVDPNATLATDDFVVGPPDLMGDDDYGAVNEQPEDQAANYTDGVADHVGDDVREDVGDGDADEVVLDMNEELNDESERVAIAKNR